MFPPWAQIILGSALIGMVLSDCVIFARGDRPFNPIDMLAMTGRVVLASLLICWGTGVLGE